MWFAEMCPGYRVIYRDAHILLEEIAEATLDRSAKSTWNMELLSTASHVAGFEVTRPSRFSVTIKGRKLTRVSPDDSAQR